MPAARRTGREMVLRGTALQQVVTALTPARQKIEKDGVINKGEREMIYHFSPSLIYANREPQPNAKYSCAASVAIAR